MKIEALKRELLTAAHAIGLDIDFAETGSPDWHRGFIRLPITEPNTTALTLGKIVIYKGEYQHLNWYVTPSRDIDKYDFWQWAWTAMWSYQTLLTRGRFHDLTREAMALHKADFNQKLLWRKSNPKTVGKCRKRLEGRSPNAFLRDLMHKHLEAGTL